MTGFEFQNFATSTHTEELDSIFNQESDDFDDVVFENRNLIYNAKIYFRYLRKKLFNKIREKTHNGFTDIIYLTLDCSEYTPNSQNSEFVLEYINEMRKQYPDNDIRVLIPIINLDKEDFRPTKRIEQYNNEKVVILEKTSLSFDYFMQNKMNEAILYKYPKNKLNIQVYGLYSPLFSYCKSISELVQLKYLAPFVKASRICIKKFGSIKKEEFKPDIVHCENIPFFLGGEFENKLPYPIKVLQVIKDFTQLDVAKTEAFWAAINLVDKNGMKKICRDDVIKKCVAGLFNLHNTKKFYQMKECLRYIYKNYYKFRKFIDKGEDIDENILFNNLNRRVLQIFPQMANEDDIYYNSMIHTLKKVDLWVTTSKTYYKEIYEKSELSGKMSRILNKTKQKSNYVSFGKNMELFPLENTRQIYHCFNLNNFREERNKNKIQLLKEFSLDRIKTKFVDSSLFKNEEYEIYGNLDSFYNSPLLFANPDIEVFANGIDILFNSILKLFETHKNFQVIICIKDGMKNNFIKNWIEFISKNRYFNGKWVFIDGEINLPKFLAGSDMILIPRRVNMVSAQHFFAMHYGCVPIVSRNGILNDTIPDIFDDMSNGCGFKTKKSLLFEDEINEIYMTPLLKALNLYQNNSSGWNLLVKNCIKQDFNWSFKVLEKYDRLYKDLL